MERPRTSDDTDTALLRLAAQLRRAAEDAGRADVVAKVDEIVVLVAGDPGPGGGRGRAAAVMQLLDGLGF